MTVGSVPLMSPDMVSAAQVPARPALFWEGGRTFVLGSRIPPLRVPTCPVSAALWTLEATFSAPECIASPAWPRVARGRGRVQGGAEPPRFKIAGPRGHHPVTLRTLRVGTSPIDLEGPSLSDLLSRSALLADHPSML